MFETVLRTEEPAAVAREPDHAAAIAAQRTDGPFLAIAVLGHPRAGIVAEDAVGLDDDPDPPLGVAVQIGNGFGDALPVGVVQRHRLETLRLGVVDVEPRIGSDPQPMVPGLDQTLDQTVSQPRRLARRMLEDLELFAVVAVQSVLGAEPHETPFVLQDRGDGILRQAVVDPQPIEMDRLRRGDQHPGEKLEKQQMEFFHGSFGLVKQRYVFSRGCTNSYRRPRNRTNIENQ